MKSTAVIMIILAASLCYAADRAVMVKPKATATGTERKTALVIGNSAYPTSPLKNPVNDARAMARALRELGFVVDERTNLTMVEMKQAVETFGDGIKEGGVGLFYYAGHGIQVAGRNYLIPVDANIQGESEVDYKAVDAGLVLAKMDLAQNEMNIVILDACRNNPFPRSFRSANAGLASMDAPSGTLIAYATAPGKVASDGTGENGLYTQEVVKAIRRPGIKIEDAFKQVRSGVQTQTQGKQVPWESSSLVGDFYFSGSGKEDTSKLESLAEGSKEREAELARLKILEAENAKQKEKERAEIAKKEKELATLDAQIAIMKSKLGTPTAGPNDNLRAMVAMVQQKEADASRLEQLKRQREYEDAKRMEEIEQLKKEAENKRIADIEADIADYQKIATSDYGKDMIPAAWASLVSKYPEAKNVKLGDLFEFRMATRVLDSIIVKDAKTGLMWQKKDEGVRLSWDYAITYCEKLKLTGHSDWRLPSTSELSSIFVESEGKRSIDTAKFPGTKFTCYWSSSKIPLVGSTRAWCVDFSNGETKYSDDSDQYYVRCVR